jgi:hypothetical protein
MFARISHQAAARGVNVYWSRSDLTVAVDFRITGKSACVGGLKSYFSRRGAENTQVQGASNEGQGNTKTILAPSPSGRELR